MTSLYCYLFLTMVSIFTDVYRDVSRDNQSGAHSKDGEYHISYIHKMKRFHLNQLDGGQSSGRKCNNDKISGHCTWCTALIALRKYFVQGLLPYSLSWLFNYVFQLHDGNLEGLWGHCNYIQLSSQFFIPHFRHGVIQFLMF